MSNVDQKIKRKPKVKREPTKKDLYRQARKDKQWMEDTIND